MAAIRTGTGHSIADDICSRPPVNSPSPLSRKPLGKTAKHLALREYVPLVSFLLAWFLIGFSVGHADVTRLIAANAFAQAARALCTVDAAYALAQRRASTEAVWRKSLGAALRINLVSLALSAALLAALALLMASRDMLKAGAMIAIMILALPARTPGTLFVARRDRATMWRIGSSAVAVGGATLVFAFHWSWLAAAIVIALRDWGGLAAAALFGKKRSFKGSPPEEPLTFAEAATQTEASARRRLGYRLLRTLFGVLGPVGNLAARTARQAGRLDQRIARLMPHSRAGFALFTAVTSTASAVLLLVSREPSTLLASSALASMAASGAAALMWWSYRDFGAEIAEDDED
jgi:hypothetical protein